MPVIDHDSLVMNRLAFQIVSFLSLNARSSVCCYQSSLGVSLERLSSRVVSQRPFLVLPNKNEDAHPALPISAGSSQNAHEHDFVRASRSYASIVPHTSISPRAAKQKL